MKVEYASRSDVLVFTITILICFHYKTISVLILIDRLILSRWRRVQKLIFFSRPRDYSYVGTIGITLEDALYRIYIFLLVNRRLLAL